MEEKAKGYPLVRLNSRVLITNKRILGAIAYRTGYSEQEVVDRALTYYFKACYPKVYEKFTPIADNVVKGCEE